MKTPERPSRILFALMILSIPGFLFLILLQLLPLDRFTSRTWESLALGSNRNAPFLPLQSLEKMERGDLALQDPGAPTRKIRFETDEFGYRNVAPACADPFGVVIGDSMAVGGGLSQEETPASQLSRAFHRCVRSFGGGSFPYALNSVYGLGLKPKQVFLILTQRSAGTLKAFSDPRSPGFGVHWVPKIQALDRGYLQVRRNLYWNFRARHGVLGALERIILPGGAATDEIPATEATPILFYPSDWERRVSDEAMDSDLSHLEELAERLAPLGAELVYTFVPNKSTIYPGPFVDQDQDFIDRFLPRTRGRRARFIDLFHPFREDWAKGILNHQRQDTHWNLHGVERFVQEVERGGP